MGAVKNLKATIELAGKVDPSLMASFKSASGQMKALKATGKIAAGGLARGASAVGRAAVAGAKVAAGAVMAAAPVIAKVGKDALDQYSRYEQAVGGMDTLFKGASGKMQRYAAQAYKTAGLSTNDYMETATSFAASMVSSVGGDVNKAARLSNMAVKDMSDNANKMGTSMDSIIQTYQSLSRGNYAMLDNLKLGYGGTKKELQRLLADAGKLSHQKFDISKFGDVTKAIHVIQQQMGITGTTAREAATTIEGSVNSAKAAWTNWLTGLGNDNANMDKLTSQLVTSVQTAAKNIVPRLKVIAKSAIGQLFGDDAAKGFSSALKGVKQFGSGLVSAIDFKGFKSAMAGIKTALDAAFPSGGAKGAKGFGKQVGEAINGLIPVLEQAPGAIKAVSDALGWFAQNSGTVVPAVTAIGIAFKGYKVVSSIAGPMKAVGEAISGIAGKAAGAAAGTTALATAEGASAGASAAAAPSLLQVGGAALMIGAGAALAAVGMGILAQAAIAIASAGAPAAVAMVAMVGGIAALAAGAVVAGPALTAGAVGLVAFGAAVALVGAGVGIASAGIALLASQFPTIAASGPSAASALAMVAASALALGPAALACAAGMAPLAAAALLAAAGFLALAPGALLAGTGIALLAASAPAAGAGLTMLAASATMAGPAMLAAAPGAVALGTAALAASPGLAAAGAAAGVLAGATAVLAATLPATAAAMTMIGAVAPSLGPALSGVAPAMTALVAPASMLAGPLAAIAAAAAALAGALAAAAGGAMALSAALMACSAGALAVSASLLTAQGSAIAAGASFRTIASSAASAMSSAVSTVQSGMASIAAACSRSFTIGNISVGHIPTFYWTGSFDAKSKSVAQLHAAAAGGFTSGVTIAGEAGTEAVISFDPAYRAANIAYWARAGQLLGALDGSSLDPLRSRRPAVRAGSLSASARPSSAGVAGAMMRPTGAALLSGVANPMSAAAGASGPVSISLGGVTFSPTVNVSGGGDSSEADVIEQLREQQDEFLDLLDAWLMDKEAEFSARL